MKLKAGDFFPAKTFTSVLGEAVHVPDKSKLVHLQFRRFAGCPICNTHVGELLRNADDIKKAGIKEVLFFHSPAASIRRYQDGIPFTFVADREKQYYTEFGVETSIMFVSLSAIWAAIRGMFRGRFGLMMHRGPLGLPADFLIAPTGQVMAAHYGRHAYDQWSADELIDIAENVRSPVHSPA